MALSQEERQIAEYGAKQGKSAQDIQKAIASYRLSNPAQQPAQEQPNTQTFAVPTMKEFGTELKNVGTGALKGFIGGATGLAQGINTLGTGVQALISPQSFSDLKQRQEQIGSPFSGSNAMQINEQMKAQNTGELTGKSLEFIAELLTPTGARKAIGTGATAGADIFKGVSSKLSGIPDDLVEGGVKVKDKVIDTISGLDEKTKTALTRTPKEVFSKILEQGKNAMKNDSVFTPLEEVGNNIIQSLGKVKKATQTIGEKKSSFIKIPEPFEKSAIQEFKGGLQSFLNSRTLIENDKPIVSKIVSEFKKLGDTPTKGQVDKFIDFAQGEIYSGSKNLVQKMSDKTKSGLDVLVGKLNKSLRDQLPPEYAKLNKQYSELTKFLNEANIRLGKEGSSAGSFVKRLFSPSDARTKVLFEQLQKITGQDFTRDARLAKFVMDSLGDTRAGNILEQIPTSASGVIGKIVDYAGKKISDPIKSAERFINKADTSVAEQAIKNIQKRRLNRTKQGGYINIGGKIVKEIDELTKKELYEATKFLEGKASQIGEKDFDKLAQKFNLNINGSVDSIKKRILNILDKTKTKPVKPR